jgi:hypothetical protein
MKFSLLIPISSCILSTFLLLKHFIIINHTKMGDFNYETTHVRDAMSKIMQMF